MRSNALDLLDNVTWHALSGTQARFAAGEGAVRRYAKGFSPIIGLADPGSPDFDTLARYCELGEHFYAERWAGRAPSGWRVDAETTMFKMVWEGAAPPPDAGLDAVPLAAAHAEAALELATLTRPGPFGLRTIELGEYLGVFVDGALVAMAGERMQAGNLREISGVCTHPSFQGRGLARRLMNELVRRELARGEAPFLHVLRDNLLARDLYRRMGFRNHREVVVRVVARH